MSSDSVQIGLAAFLDYTRSNTRGCVNLVKAQRTMYLDPDRRASAFYGPFRAALRRAVNSPDPERVLTRTVAKARPVQRSHFEALRAGFLQWWGKTRATGVPISSGRWQCGQLTINIPNQGCLGLRYRNGRTELVLPYLKEPELTAEDAYPALRILELESDEMLPGAAPAVLDVRRGKLHKLRKNTNRGDLDAYLEAEAAKYLVHWQAAA